MVREFWFVLLAMLLLSGCAFSNSNPFTGDTKWTILDACNDCSYNDEGMPTGGQASGSLSPEDAAALGAVLGDEEEEAAECEADCSPVEEEATGLADGVVELPEEESDAILESVYGPEEDVEGPK